MPPFTYEKYANPYVQSLSALIQQPGQIEAARAQQVAAAQAQAAQQSGQAWAGAAQGVGNAMTGALQQATDPRRQFEAMQLARAKQQQAGEGVIDRAMQGQVPNGPQAEGDGPAAAQHPYLDSEGLADPKKISDLLAANGMGHLAPELLKGVEAQNSSILAYKQHQQEAGQKQTIMLGSVANTTLALMQAGMPFQDAAAHASSSLVATGAADAPTVQKMIAQLSQLPPDQLTAQLAEMKKTAAKLGPTTTLADGAVQIDMFGNKRAENPKIEKPTEASLAADAATLGTATQTPTAAASKAALAALQAPTNAAREEAARHDKETERIQGLQVGRAEAAQRETERHNKAMEAANNPLAALTGGTAPRSAAQAEGAHGEDFLKALPPQVASEVKAYAEGRRPFPAGFALKAPYFQSLIQMVGQYDPTFDAVNYNARSKTRADFTSGASAKNINALNTVTQHLSQLSDAADALNNTSLPAWNTVANLVSKQTGNSTVTNFATTKKAVTDELTRAWRQAGGSSADIKSWSDVLDAAGSPAQLHGAIAEIGNLLEGKLSAMRAQYAQGMGTTDTTGMQVITPEAQATLSKLETRAGGGQAAATAFSVKAPNGKTYNFKSQADLDAFKKSAGL